jgi:transposase-like protein
VWYHNRQLVLCGTMITTKELEERREQRGLEIVNKESQITRINDTVYKVLSQSGHGEYMVCFSRNEWHCECPDHRFRDVKCKHIWAVTFSLKMREHVRQNVVIEEVSVSCCKLCHSSNIKRFEVRHNKSGDIQRFQCADCGKTFSVNIGFERMKHNPQAITSAMQLYFSGESLRNTMKSLKLLGVGVSHQTVYNWIRKYVSLMDSYIDKLIPNVGNTWRADELWVKVRGDKKYLFSLMDDETRYWIAQEVAETKHTHNARKLFKMAEKVAGKKPQILITDGLRVYHDAFMEEWSSFEDGWSEHNHKIGFTSEHNNNKMERFNGEVRDREKTMRGLKKTTSPILKGYQVFHNYIREHEGLEGKTPSEACGIQIKGQNKWKTLIENASKEKQQSPNFYKEKGE